MINIEAAVTAKFPLFANTPALLRVPTIKFLQHLLHESQINAFLEENADVGGFEWIDRVFEYLHFSYSISARDRCNIPATGRIVIVANHPIGSLDGLALLRLVGEIRGDVKIVANDMLSQFAALNNLLIPVDNMTASSALPTMRAVASALKNEEAVILFPAGEVSRASPLGVRDANWRGGFLHMARKADAPILPVLIKARNSLLFYGASMLYKPLGTMLLSDAMFRHQSSLISFRVGEAIAASKLKSTEVLDRTLVQRLRRHVYKLGKNSKPVFETERTVAHPENPQSLQRELKQAILLGVTRDNNAIYLFDWHTESAVMREIGRLRELAFRQVGEGSGKRRDLDCYDQHYRHLVLWDREALEIAGAYRIGEGKALLKSHGIDAFYTSSLYQYKPEFNDILENGIELGRSFVNPRYWGKASLDYLWQGIGAYLQHNPQVRYLFGPVSMSASYPRALTEELMFYFSTFYAAEQAMVSARHPFNLSASRRLELEQRYTGLNKETGLSCLQDAFSAADCKIPVLYRQYSSLFEDDGFQALVFSIDPDFADCLDGFCLADLHRLKAAKRARYLTASRQKS